MIGGWFATCSTLGRIEDFRFPQVLAAIMDSALSEGIEKILLTQTKR